MKIAIALASVALTLTIIGGASIDTHSTNSPRDHAGVYAEHHDDCHEKTRVQVVPTRL